MEANNEHILRKEKSQMKERICCLENELIVKNSIIKNQQKDIDKLKLVQKEHQTNYYTF